MRTRRQLHISNSNIKPKPLVFFELRNGTPVTPRQGNVHTNCGFSMPFYFRVKNPVAYPEIYLGDALTALLRQERPKSKTKDQKQEGFLERG